MDPLPDHSLTQASLSPPRHSATVATIDLTALAHNVSEVRRRIPPGCHILAVVKADAYGHGAVAISRALMRLDVQGLCVASLAEGITLREADISAPILVMGSLLPTERAEAVAQGLTPVLSEADQVRAFAECVKHRADPDPVHVKIDTGMGRLGVSPSEVGGILRSQYVQGPLRVEGVMTHLADADGDDVAFTANQLDRFRSVAQECRAEGYLPSLVHAANSAAILRHPSSHFTAVRPGIMLYGYHTLGSNKGDLQLSPVLSITTMVVQVRSIAPGESVSYNQTFRACRPSRIAVLPVGYADGYNRLLSNCGTVLVRGQEARVVGKVCMDMTMVDVTEIPGTQPGDEAVLIGKQGTRQISAADIAADLGTIPYEVLCTIGPRVPRICRPSVADVEESLR